MKRKIFPKIHDLLKLVGKINEVDIHYCPEVGLAKVLNQTEYATIQNHEIYPTLRHHCYFLSWRHKCSSPYPIGYEELFLAFSDWQASTISRKLRVISWKLQKTYFSSGKTFHIWRHSKANYAEGKDIHDQKIIEELVEGKDAERIFESRMESLIERAEAKNCPFASLLTHSELTEKWYHFFLENLDFFKLKDKDQFINNYDARRYIDWFTKSKNRKTIYLLRIKIFANEKLSRLADVRIIQQIPAVLKTLREKIPRSSLLYQLSDEMIFVACSMSENEESEELFFQRLTKYLQILMNLLPTIILKLLW